MVDIGKIFGFGDIKTLGEGTSRLVIPFFSVAVFLVILYFLVGAFRYLISQGNKEELEAAKQIIYHAMVGFILLMLTFLVLQFLLSYLFDIKFKLIG